MDRPYSPPPHPFHHATIADGAWCYLCEVDPRARVLMAVALAVMAAAAQRWEALATVFCTAVVLLVLSGISPAAVLRRLLPLEMLMLVLIVLLPLSTPGTPLVQLGPLAFSQEGLLLAAKIAVKGNGLVMALWALVGTMEITTLGHTLSHLRVPGKLTHLLLFTVRYLDVLHREYGRLRAAMKVRGFRPRMNGHTYRSYGYLVGMLLVRSFDRAERIVAAMKCRGFRGRFYVLEHFAYSWRDIPFGAAAIGLLALLVYLEWR